MSEGPSHRRAARTELASIQFLRFLASTLVVLFHTEVQLYRLSHGARGNQVLFASYGTDLFFVISGFIMVYITWDRPQTFLTFMRNRLIRIVPLYWLFNTVLVLLVLALPHLFHSTRLELGHALASFAFLPWQHPVLQVPQPLMAVGWTLNYYMVFYVIFGLFLAQTAGRRIAAVATVLAAMVALEFALKSEATAFAFYGNPVLLEFVYGMAVAWIFLREPLRSPLAIMMTFAVALAIFGVGLSFNVSEDADRVIFWGGSAAALLLGCVLAERRWGWPLAWLTDTLGSASYSIFLSSLFSLGALGMLMQNLHAFEILGGRGAQIVLVLGGWAAGLATYRWIEQPVMRALKSAQRRSEPALPAPTLAQF